MKKRSRVSNILTAEIGLMIVFVLALAGCKGASLKPQARHGAKMVYDPLGKQILLFGGRGNGGIVGDLYNDLWAFDLDKNQWQEVTTASQPSPRISPGMVYDPVGQQLILFGGYSDSGRLDDTWLFDLNRFEWQEIFSDLNPPARSDMGLAYDGVNHIAVLFGGYCQENLRDRCDDTWIFDPVEKNWIEKNPISSPPVMYGHSLSYDSLKNQFLLWGGHMSVFSQGGMASAGYNGSVWTYTLADNLWQEIPPGTQRHPSARYWHQATFDSVNQGLLTFGGDGGYRYLSDTWFFDSGTESWTKKTAEYSPPARIVASLVYCPEYGQMILFGGLDKDFNNLEDTWIYSTDSGEWEQISP